MEKIRLENIHEKPKYIYIILSLAKYTKGLHLNELTYLLTHQDRMKNFSALQRKFGNKKNRKNIFKIKQRIFDHLSTLREIGLVYRDNQKYKIDLPTLFYWCDVIDAKIEYQKRLEKSEKKCNEISEMLKNKHPERNRTLGTATRITIKHNFPGLWKELLEYKTITTNEFVLK